MNTPTERTAALVALLPTLYPDAHCELNFSGPLDLLVATILSAQCTDVRVNLVTRDLFARYRTAADYANAGQEELENAIRSINFYRNKARAIRGAAAALLERHGGEVPATQEALTALPGIGRKTANVVLGNALGVDEGVVVDTHVGRLSRRLGLSAHEDPVKVEADLMALLPRERWTVFPHWLIAHGRRRCTARNPDCAGCELRALCPTAFQHGPGAGEKKGSTAPAKSRRLPRQA